MRGQGTSFARLTQVLGAVAQSGSAPRSHRGGQGFESPQLHREVFTFQQGPCSRLDPDRPPGLPQARSRADAPRRFRGNVFGKCLTQLQRAFPSCGQAPPSMWAVPQPALILPAQGQT